MSLFYCYFYILDSDWCMLGSLIKFSMMGEKDVTVLTLDVPSCEYCDLATSQIIGPILIIYKICIAPYNTIL